MVSSTVSPGEQDAEAGYADYRGIVAVDVEPQQLDLQIAHPQAAVIAVERPRRHHQRADRGRPLEGARLDRLPACGEHLRRAGAGDDLTPAERGVAGDVIEVPVAEHDGDSRRSTRLSVSRIARPWSTDTPVSTTRASAPSTSA